AVELIRFLEQALVDAATLVLATCDEERRVFVEEYGAALERTALAPNGFEPTTRGTADGAVARAGAAPVPVFVGGATPPHVEAAEHIVGALAPALPDVEFRIMGAVCERLPATLPRNVTPLGFVDDAEKDRQIAGCAVVLNPLFSGAGTNLKMLD